MFQHIKNDLLEAVADADGIVTLTINQVNEPANLFSVDFVKAFVSFSGAYNYTEIGFNHFVEC